MNNTPALATCDGMTLAPGDSIIDFRGDAHIFVRVSRIAMPGKSAKIETTEREFYSHVFPGLTVIAL